MVVFEGSTFDAAAGLEAAVAGSAGVAAGFSSCLGFCFSGMAEVAGTACTYLFHGHQGCLLLAVAVGAGLVAAAASSG